MSQFLSDYDYSYPSQLVAQEPLADRAASRMMVLSPKTQEIRHAQFQDLPEYLKPGDLVVVNDTAVLASRLFAQKPTGGRVEVFLVRPLDSLEWSVFLSPVRGLKEGMALQIFSREKNEPLPLSVTVTSLAPEDFRVRFFSAAEEKRAIGEAGEMPLPPYIKRTAPRPTDRERYQTVFAQNPGAVAAPTAGLHFSPEMQNRLKERGVSWAGVTLHVGPGTFLPVKTEHIADHPMHAEWYEIPEATLGAVEACRRSGGRVVAVGTTTLRALESYGRNGKSRGWTDLYVRPGFAFRMTDVLLTNFHQPKSSLLILVSAWAGREFILRAYGEAVAQGYRLFSYGDCMLVFR